MKSSFLSVISSVALGLSMVQLVSAGEPGASFSAEMVRKGGDGQESRGKMYVADGRVRTEMSQDERQVVRITDTKRQMEWILFPEQHSYIERAGSAGLVRQAARGSDVSKANPCAGVPGLACRKIGEETIAGRPAIGWEMTSTRQDQTLKGEQWVDQQRGVPLRQVMPDGQKMELKLVGNESLAGRPVEKWEMIVSAPDRKPTRSLQWYDPELELAIREEFPGGFVSELKNIRVGGQPDSLFTVPAGYQRITMPGSGL